MKDLFSHIPYEKYTHVLSRSTDAFSRSYVSKHSISCSSSNCVPVFMDCEVV